VSDMGDAAATAAEHARFLVARKGDATAAAEMLEGYLQWRTEELPKAELLGKRMPKLCSFLDCRCQQGRRVLLVVAAMFDNNIASGEQYALAMARTMDEGVDRDSDEKLTVVVDTRGGAGFANPRPWSVLPWIKALVRTLQPNFPERLGQVYIVPVPWVAKTLWATVSVLLDEVTSAKVVLLSGPAGRADPMPEELSAHLDASALLELEGFRQACVEEALSAAAAAPIAEAAQ